MEELIYYLQKEAPYLLDKIIGVDYLQGDMTAIPVLIVSLGDGVGLVPIAGNSLYGIYIPEDEKFIPLTERSLDLITVQQENTFVPVNRQNIVDNPNLYDMLKPPMSGRTIHASSEVYIVTEPISKEYYEFGFVIVDNRDNIRFPKVYINPVETLFKFTQPELGKPQVIFTIDGEPVPAIIYKDSDADHYMLISSLGAVHKLKRLPISCTMECGCFPEYNPSDKFIVVHGGTYWDKPSEQVFGPEDVVIFTDRVSKPIVTEHKSIFPASYQKVFLPEEELPEDTFAYNPSHVYDMIKQRCLRIHYTGGGDFAVNNEVMNKIDLAKFLAQDKGLPKDDVYVIIKKAQEEGSIDVYISDLQDSLSEEVPKDTQMEEIIEAFDSQMRVFLQKVLEGKDTTSVEKVINSLKNAFEELVS